MTMWIAVGDETGIWDIENGQFGNKHQPIGVAWVLGAAPAWQKALTLPRGASTPLATFSTSFAKRLPDSGITTMTDKYHVLDVWKRCTARKLKSVLRLDEPHEEPILETLRDDLNWLLQESGLIVLAAGDSAGRAMSAGLDASGDGMRERARAYAALLGVVLPFLPMGATLVLRPEARSESLPSDTVLATERAGRAHARKQEPYRDFMGRLREDLHRVAGMADAARDGDKAQVEILSWANATRSPNRLQGEFPLLTEQRGVTEKAMSGLADLAAALAPRPDPSVRIEIPEGWAPNLWSGTLAEVLHAF